MPLWKWTVEPIYVSRGTAGKCDTDGVLDATCNRTLVATLHQLTCLLRLAHYVFNDIGEECEAVYKRAESLRGRVDKCCRSTQTLNARKVIVPVGDIDWYCQVKDHYLTTYVQETELIVPSTRPIYVNQLYEKASTTPLPLIREIDRFRTDGVRGSKIFARTPVFADSLKKNKHLDIETRRPASFALARDWDDLGITFLKNECSGPCSPVAPSRDLLADLNRLPSPEERALAMSMEYPSSVVPIDITGNNFHRMSSLRRSLLHVDFFIKRKKQKKNKRRNTISGNTSKELEEALKATTSKDLVDTSCQTEDNEIGWFGKIFNKRNSLIKKDKKSPQEENNNVLSKIAATVRNRDSVNLFDSIESSKSSKKSDRNSLVMKEKSESNNTTTKKTVSNKSKARSILPISTLSAAMTVAVKMRHCKKNGDDGRSSSGNWSATSSTRVSVDSDQQHATSSSNSACSPSESSLGKDSVLSDYTPQDTDNSKSQEGNRMKLSTDRRHSTSLVSPKTTIKETTHSWLQSLDQECQSGTLTPDNCTSDSTVTPQVLSPYIRRRRYCQNESSPPIIDDEGSSVYSVDTDGYYTSMHTDSGLKTRTPQHECQNRGRRDSGSSVSTLGNVSINSLLSRATIGRSSKSDSFREERKIPPPPPIRTSSAKRDSNSDGTSSSQNNGGDTSTSESSDRETVERLRKKTAINSSRYPSMCAVSPEPSDDESSTKVKPPDQPIREKSPPKFNMYYDQSPQNSKFLSFLQRSKSPEEALKEHHENLVTSFSPECPDVSSPKKANEEKLEEPKVVPTSILLSPVFKKDEKSTIKRITPGNSNNQSNHSQSCSFIPTAVNRPVARVTLDPNGKVIYASNSLGRRRDGHPLRSSPLQVSEQKFATLPMRSSQSTFSSPIVAHNGTFVRLDPSDRIRSPVFNQKTNCPSTEKKLSSPSNEIKEVQTEKKYGYRRTMCGPRLPMNGYNPTSVIKKQAEKSDSGEDNSSLPNGQLPIVPPEMPPLSRFVNHHSIEKDSNISRIGVAYRGISTQYVPLSTSVQNSLRSIASYSPYHSPYYGGIPKLTSPVQSTISMTPTSAKTNIPLPHSKTVPSLSSLNNAYSKVTQNVSSSYASSRSPVSTPQKQVSFQSTPPTTCSKTQSFQSPIVSKIPPFHNKQTNFALHSSTPTSRNGIVSMENNITQFNSNGRMRSLSPLSLQTNTPLNSSRSPTLQSATNFLSSYNFNLNSSAQSISTSPSVTSPPLQSPVCKNRFQAIKTPPVSNGLEKKTMTPADLFAAIHNSKKKHNIKTDLDISSSSSVSSRSNSPSCNSVTSNKSVLVETGFLSPRNQSNTPRNRRSWTGDYKSFSPVDKSLANDRLGPPKPTSMYDFKMLLLQTRSNNDSPGARVSASERLRVQPKNEMNNNNTSHSLPTSPIKMPTPVFSGHSTVPIKRGSKGRSSIRYDLMYQPILEDCCEETEAQKSPKTPPSRTPLETSFVNATTNCANHLPPPQHWTEPFVPIKTASSRGASTWV